MNYKSIQLVFVTHSLCLPWIFNDPLKHDSLLFLPFLPFFKLTRSKPVTGKIPLMQCVNFFLGDLEKMCPVILIS
ncbi:MAG: hypothetical protein COX19_09865 [Desulfobacterales bacterium CG23_combo_of_CG06-09_8_20_14_all_51_8]|nr:MAG: hypothetical protein COX19_09865 [Desulfobacterales bacterium CG23_combo_of_CG06-09_8_20_14_all_51_8]